MASPRVHVVTGAASGIGRAVAERVGAAGDRVIGVDVAEGGPFADVVVDLASHEGRAALPGLVAEAAGGGVDAVIACAGLAAPEPVTVRVNFFGAVATLEGLRPLLLGRDAPRAVVVASSSVQLPPDPAVVEACLANDEEAAVVAAARAGLLVYGSSKRAIARWVRRAAPTGDWAGAGIPLNAVGPGVIRTPMTQPLFDAPGGEELMFGATPMPLRGPGTPEEIAALLCWLASPENTLCTGQVIFADGGADAVVRGDDIW